MAIGTVIILGVLAVTIIGSALGVLFSDKVVYAALYLVINFLAVGLVYLALGAPFIAIAQVTVYVGSIMVLFLFVIMLLGPQTRAKDEPLRGQRPLGYLAVAAFLTEIGLYIYMRVNPVEILPTAVVEFATPSSIGTLLFTKYMLPFEAIGVLLLVAVVGAIVLSRDDRDKTQKSQPGLEGPKE